MVAIPDAIPIDSRADLALRTEREAAAQSDLRCDGCDEIIEGEPEGRGLFLWSRGDETRLEEPPLCPSCAAAVSVTALQMWSIEGEEEG